MSETTRYTGPPDVSVTEHATSGLGAKVQGTGRGETGKIGTHTEVSEVRPEMASN